MKAFRFSLAKLLSWRQQQQEVEEYRLRALLAEAQAVEGARGRLSSEQRGAAAELLGRRCLTTEDLEALERWRSFVRREEARLAAIQRELASQIAVQRRVLLEACRGVEILRRLREKQIEEWRLEAGREEERMIQELVVAQWRNGSRP
jgi:hypothetical protein